MSKRDKAKEKDNFVEMCRIMGKWKSEIELLRIASKERELHDCFAGRFAAELLGLEVEEPAGYAKRAYDLADAMMAERKRREEGKDGT